MGDFRTSYPHARASDSKIVLNHPKQKNRRGRIWDGIQRGRTRATRSTQIFVFIAIFYMVESVSWRAIPRRRSESVSSRLRTRCLCGMQILSLVAIWEKQTQDALECGRRGASVLGIWGVLSRHFMRKNSTEAMEGPKNTQKKKEIGE